MIQGPEQSGLRITSETPTNILTKCLVTDDKPKRYGPAERYQFRLSSGVAHSNEAIFLEGVYYHAR